MTIGDVSSLLVDEKTRERDIKTDIRETPMVVLCSFVHVDACRRETPSSHKNRYDVITA
jgi:hypothetical protein